MVMEKVADVKNLYHAKNVIVYRDNNRVDDSNIMRPRNGRRIEHVNSSGQKQMQSESH